MKAYSREQQNECCSSKIVIVKLMFVGKMDDNGENDDDVDPVWMDGNVTYWSRGWLVGASRNGSLATSSVSFDNSFVPWAGGIV